MQLIWEPILCKCRGTSEVPTWEHFRAEYEVELPPVSPCPEPTLSDADVGAFLQARASRKAGGLDGWATVEAKALPAAIQAVFAEALRSTQNSGQVPSAFKHVPNPALRKGEGIFPE
eukprot:7126436-Pyramimonas_sp.AAC.1